MHSGRSTLGGGTPPGSWTRFCSTSLLLFSLCASILFPVASFAKDTPLSATVLYDGPDGPAYALLTGVMINGKTEMRLCGGVAKFDKKAYGKLAKVSLRNAKTLERTPDGVLMLRTDAEPVCVVPSGLGFEQGGELTPAEAADLALLQGTVASSKAAAQAPPVKRGIQIIFVTALDAEMAEYLLAQRLHSIEGWQRFLGIATLAHATEARKALADLYEQSGESALAAYRKSVAAHAPDLSKLKLAQAQAEQAGKTVSGYAPAVSLTGSVHAELDALVKAARAELEAYRKGLAEHSSGYAHLLAAEQQNEALLGVNSTYPSAVTLHNELMGERTELETAMQNAEARIASKDYDEALHAVSKFECFAPEIPRIRALVDAAFEFHFARGQELSRQEIWSEAIEEFRKAVAVKNDSDEARAAQKNAELQLLKTKNRAAADTALAQSQSFAEQKQFVEAYQVLDRLPPAPRELVSEQLAALTPDFVSAASQEAQKLQSVHVPIRGRFDEDGVRLAYALLNQAFALSNDQSIKLKRDLLADKISAFYLDLAKRYLARPLGSGVGLGWFYLSEANEYKPDLSAIKDERNQFLATYQLRSRLSVGIEFRDQTSRRESSGFADQLDDAITAELENMRIKVVRHNGDTANTTPPNFLLAGQISQLRVDKNPKMETLQSEYRFNTREVKNEAWVKANYEVDTAKLELTNAEQALILAQGRKKQGEIATANTAVTAAEKKFEDLRNKRDSIDEYRTEDISRPYQYIKTTYNVKAIIELTLRVTDPTGNLVQSVPPVQKGIDRTFVVLQDVKPEDTKGVKAQDQPPDEAQIREELEIQARDALVATIRDTAAKLPDKILARARQRAAANDRDGAAEDYILYLNATTGAEAPGRSEAAKFLEDNFNVSPRDAS